VSKLSPRSVTCAVVPIQARYLHRNRDQDNSRPDKQYGHLWLKRRNRLHTKWFCCDTFEVLRSQLSASRPSSDARDATYVRRTSSVCDPSRACAPKCFHQHLRQALRSPTPSCVEGGFPLPDWTPNPDILRSEYITSSKHQVPTLHARRMLLMLVILKSRLWLGPDWLRPARDLQSPCVSIVRESAVCIGRRSSLSMLI
jgi:hypothetical protein